MKKTAALLLMLVAALTIVPLVGHADGEAVTDPSATAVGSYYLRVDAANGTAELWQETNGYPLLQIEGGTVTDDDGNVSTVDHDTKIA